MQNIPYLDLHGKLEDEVFDLLDKFIREHKDQEQLLIIVGKGKGIIKNQTIQYLKKAHYPWEYERVKGIVNEGALLIDLY